MEKPQRDAVLAQYRAATNGQDQHHMNVAAAALDQYSEIREGAGRASLSGSRHTGLDRAGGADRPGQAGEHPGRAGAARGGLCSASRR
jgi:hypothetical protein